MVQNEENGEKWTGQWQDSKSSKGGKVEDRYNVEHLRMGSFHW